MARDGLYKGLKMGPHYKKVVKCVERPAERGRPARQAMEEALLKDAMSDISPAFRRALNGLADESSAMLPGLSALEVREEQLRQLAGVSPLASCFMEQLTVAEMEGRRGHDMVFEAARRALDDFGESRYRQMEEHCRNEGASPQILRALRDAVQDADRAWVASEILGLATATERVPLSKTIDLDEDISVPR